MEREDWKLSFKSRRVGEPLRLQSRQLWLKSKGFSFFHASIKKRGIRTFINLKCPTGRGLVQHEEIRTEVMKLFSHLSILSSQQHIAAVHQIFKKFSGKKIIKSGKLSINNRGAIHSKKLLD